MRVAHLAATGLAAGLVFLSIAPAHTATMGFTVESGVIEPNPDCLSPLLSNDSFRVSATGIQTTDADMDILVGATLYGSVSVNSPAPDALWTDVDIDFSISGVDERVSIANYTTGTGWLALAGAGPRLITDADAGQVVEVAVNGIEIAAEGRCTFDAALNRVGVYVNKAPDARDDAASTLVDTPKTSDVLANDDATWDSGTITSGYPSSGELASQDNLSTIPLADRGSAVRIETTPAHGTVVVESDGQITFVPDAGYQGMDSFTYTVTDNDGAFTEAQVIVEVEPAVMASLEVTASKYQVAQGETVTLTAIGYTALGNSLGDITAEVDFGSSVASDEIDGNRVTFPTASVHTVTGTHSVNGLSDSVDIDVTPASVPSPTDDDPDDSPVDKPVQLATTGGSGASEVLYVAALALFAGLVSMVVARRTDAS